MNKNNFAYFLVLLFFLPFYSCRHIEDENHHYVIPFINNSNKAIYIASPGHQDTTVTDCGALSQPQLYKALPKDMNTSALDMNVPWELAFECRDQLPNDTLTIFVFDAEKLEARNAHVKYSLLARYDLSLRDLQRANWVLFYPPLENMKDIKMWPPYKKQE